MGFLTRKFPDAVTCYTPFEIQLLVFYCTLIEAASIIEGHKIIVKPKMPIMTWVTSEKYSNKEGSPQTSFLIK